jgi:Secretion system C-terminal sorting domain
MRQVFLFILITISGLVSAQPYESIFGNTSTMWIVKWYNLDFGGIDTIMVEKDTLAYGLNWKKIIKTNSYGFFESGALLREDTLIGKVWYHPLEPGSDTTYLAFDYALQEGDTFDLSSNYDPWLTSVIVDSTYVMGTIKHITFNTFIEQSENITFIEGVGGNQGPIYKESSGLLYPYLLCAYKDGIQTYTNISYEGNCNPPTGINRVELAKDISVYPNPFNDVLHFKNLPEHRFKKVEIFDVSGRKVYSDRYQSYINLHDLMPGLYFMRLITNKGQIVTKSVICQ